MASSSHGLGAGAMLVLVKPNISISRMGKFASVPGAGQSACRGSLPLVLPLFQLRSETRN